MGRICQLVMGPAGSGKSTYCSTIITHAQTTKRTIHLVNLDPAADKFEYQPAVDIRDLISVDDVQEELGYGPNGAMIYCLEYLIQNIDFLEEELGNQEDDYLLLDLPGQIELYTAHPIIPSLVSTLHRLDYRVCGVYLLDSTFIDSPPKFFSGVLSAMSAMVQLEIPHINVLSKVDLLPPQAKKSLDKYLNPDRELLVGDITATTRPKFHALNEALVQLIEEYNMVSFIPMNIQDEDSIELVLSCVDNAVQYGEDLEPKEPVDEWEQEEDGSEEY
ncbi:GPN-loop GTPase [Fimicolochytrium jonesii]|uniref:GPN-loop GTPase n=1 Tax=Fimicolochytrium jonesii TaxID=1396493 RepID=UPI0022FE59D4|nr:GPN-loop GTPase [Fimicolochytrium jonesii]KAI8818115.1 GPN-loop GTPase [Fimicolochytrium jonesii]